jgi:hypothetical protein
MTMPNPCTGAAALAISALLAAAFAGEAPAATRVWPQDRDEACSQVFIVMPVDSLVRRYIGEMREPRPAGAPHDTMVVVEARMVGRVYRDSVSGKASSRYAVRDTTRWPDGSWAWFAIGEHRERFEIVRAWASDRVRPPLRHFSLVVPTNPICPVVRHTPGKRYLLVGAVRGDSLELYDPMNRAQDADSAIVRRAFRIVSQHWRRVQPVGALYPR